MFWGLVLKTNKRYSQQVSKAFHVSHAVLDLNTFNPNDTDAVVQVWVNTDDTDHLLANVSRHSSHVQLDLTFTEGETVAFYSKGSGTVHLTGYLLPDDFDNFPPEDDEDEESDEEVEAPVKNQKFDKKQDKFVSEEAVEEDDEDDESDDLDFEEMEGLDEEGEEEMEDEESDDEDDEDEEVDDEEEDEDEIVAPQSKKAKLDNAAKQNGLTNGKLSKKEDKKKNQQKNQKQDKQELKQKQQQQQQQNQQKPNKSAPKTLKGGVVIEDLRPGNGPVAQAGKKVTVYYEGRLKSTNKVFDSTKSGEGFKFTLGRGEVIQGWDIGVAGMKIGSKRRIICPPQVAYGAKGAPPQIPGNSTLVFEVELRNVK